MERIGQDLHDDLCQHLAGIAMLEKRHAIIWTESTETFRIPSTESV